MSPLEPGRFPNTGPVRLQSQARTGQLLSGWTRIGQIRASLTQIRASLAQTAKTQTGCTCHAMAI